MGSFAGGSFAGEVNRQLEEKRIIMTEGRINIIDATPVEAAQSGPGTGKNGQPKRDGDAGWHVKADSRGTLKSTYGYSVHTGVGFVAKFCPMGVTVLLC